MKAHCVFCDKESHSLHKCSSCGKFVYLPSDGSGRVELAKELTRGKNQIRKKYKERLKMAEVKKISTGDESDMIQVKSEIAAEIAQYLRQGK